VQADDEGGTTNAMGRGAVVITVEHGGRPIQLLTAHLKSKLLTFPGGRFAPHDEDERARFAAYALYRRTAEAASIRAWATSVLGAAGGDHAVVVTGDLNDTEQAATTQILLARQQRAEGADRPRPRLTAAGQARRVGGGGRRPGAPVGHERPVTQAERAQLRPRAGRGHVRRVRLRGW
jgi:endonuclease/exonuclease/phosphatase family metal-dependent hydrolase